MQLKAWVALGRRAVSAWVDDGAPSMGAALAYYTLFSIAPLLLIVIAVAGLAFGHDAAEGQIVIQLQGLMGADSAHAIQALLKSASRPVESVVGAVIGGAVLLLGAMSVLAELQGALDRIWRAPPRRGRSGVWTLLRARLLSFSMILGIGFLLIVSLIASAALAALGSWWAPLFGGVAVLLEVSNLVVSFALATTAFAIIYKVVPRVRVAWRDVWVGAAVTALLFSIGKFAIGLYIGKAGVGSAYGAAGSLIVIMVWMYYSAQIFLLGAEFTRVYAHRCGSRQGEALEAGSALAKPMELSPPPGTALERSRAALAEALGGRPPRQASRTPRSPATPSVPMTGADITVHEGQARRLLGPTT